MSRKKTVVFLVVLCLVLGKALLPTRVLAQDSSFCNARFYNSFNFNSANQVDKLIVSEVPVPDNSSITSLAHYKVYSPTDLYIAFPTKDGITDIKDFDIESRDAIIQSTWFKFSEGNFGVSQLQKSEDGQYMYARLDSSSLDSLVTYQLAKDSGYKNLVFRARWANNPCGNDTPLPFELLSASCNSVKVNSCRKANGKYELKFVIDYNNFSPGVRYTYDEHTGGQLNRGHNNFIPVHVSAVEPAEPIEFENTGTYTFCITRYDSRQFEIQNCSAAVNGCYSNPVVIGAQNVDCENSRDIKTWPTQNFTEGDGNGKVSQLFNLCNQIPNGAIGSDGERLINKCCKCMTNGTVGSDNKCNSPDAKSEPGSDFKPGLWTAVGCIDTSQEGLVKHILRLGLMISGGIALLVILIASLMLTTSQGDVKKTGEAKEQLTAAIMGLVFIIFSITILRFIGVDILQLPGFGK